MGQSKDKTRHDHFLAPLCGIRGTNGDTVGAHGEPVGAHGEPVGAFGCPSWDKVWLARALGPPFLRAISHYQWAKAVTNGQ